ncbi:hypothetical protein MHY01S_07100 [Meiothermus hypogaeus NBRC 106114]|uniref:Uncharacterized protein n=1 Tax=Meiothermus hypogaeus NBRC 106114 TaxID=1227553 RepID=A0A511QYS7_9DEIN|nr:hypothetical protein MHY01S_07100 [Meiothermus hypogaeus NBRC 106114]
MLGLRTSGFEHLPQVVIHLPCLSSRIVGGDEVSVYVSSHLTRNINGVARPHGVVVGGGLVDALGLDELVEGGVQGVLLVIMGRGPKDKKRNLAS